MWVCASILSIYLASTAGWDSGVCVCMLYCIVCSCLVSCPYGVVGKVVGNVCWLNLW